jgi:hypothetical protein
LCERQGNSAYNICFAGYAYFYAAGMHNKMLENIMTEVAN